MPTTAQIRNIRAIFAFAVFLFGCGLGSASSQAAGGPESTRACDDFDQWKNGRKGQAAAADTARGVELAKQRRQELKQLIARQPRQALTHAVSAAERNALPPEIAEHLEEEIAGEGTVGPLMADRCADTNAVPSVSLTVKGQVYRVFLHGNQFARRQWWRVPVQGIAVDGHAVIRDAEPSPDIPPPPRVVKSRSVKRQYDSQRLQILKHDGFDTIQMDGLQRLGDEPGTPWLPAQILNVAIPSGAEVRGLKADFKEQKIREAIVPGPIQPPFPKLPDIRPEPAAPKAAAYSRNEMTPSAVAEIVGDHNLRGHRYVSIRVNPVRYLPASKDLYMVTDLTLTLDYEPAAARPAAAPGAAMDNAAETVRRLVVNPQEVEGPAAPGAVDEGPVPASAPLAGGEDEPTSPQDKIDFSPQSYSVPENTGENATIFVNRTKAGNYTASAEYFTVNNTATAGADYTAVTGTLNWAASESGAKTFNVPILDDALNEGDETFYVRLKNITGSNPGVTNATVTIVDDDVPGTLSFITSSNSVAENAGTVTLAVQRTVGKFGPVSVQFFTSNNTAMAGTDYVATNGTLNWADGDNTNKSVTVTILNDDVYQNTHTFTVRLKNAAGATIGSPSNTTVAILEDDPMPGQVDYLIITTEALAPAFTNLALHRQSFNGFVWHLRTVSNISTNYAGVDTQAKVRACIRDYVTTRNLSYVVLGGDNTVVPDRDCYVSCGSYTESAMPTDLYYSGLDGTWDEDGDSIYGEAGTTAGNEGDLAYDVIVGRIPVESLSQANAYINKVINYDTNPPHYLARKFMMSGHMLWDSYAGTDRPTDTMNDGNRQFTDANHPTVTDAEMWTRRKYRDHVQAFGWNADTAACMFDSLTSYDASQSGDYPCSPGNLQAKYSLGWNFVINDTHGNTTILAHEGGYFDTGSAAGMTNLAVIFYTGACLSGAFDAAEPSLSEAMLRNPGGGSLIYLGCSRYGWGQYDTPPADNSSVGGSSAEYMGKFLDQIFNTKTLIAGRAFADHKAAMSGYCGYNGDYRWIQFGLNLQGDPALNIIGVKPFVSVEATDPLASEPGVDTGKFTIHRTPATNSLTVYLSWSGTATLSGGGSDIVESLPSSVTFANGESDKLLTITPVADGLVESNETVVLSLIANSAYELGSRRSATVTIVDDDNTNLPVVSISAPDTSAAEQGQDSGRFFITRTGNAAGDLTVNYAVSGTASPADYQETLNGSLIIPAGQTVANIFITPVDDLLPEGDETVVIALQPGAYVIDGGTATVVIADNESPHTVTVTAPDPNARENSSDTGLFRISRTGNTTLPLNVWFTVGGTCTPGGDYTALSSPATITSGASYVDIPVIPLDDAYYEPPETVILTLISGPAYYVVGSPSQATMTIADDDNQPPAVSLTAPTGGFTYQSGDAVTLTATATDDFGVGQVEFLCDGAVIAADTAAPYEYTWVGASGSHTLAARATDIYATVTTSATVNVTGSAIPAGPGNGFFVEWWTNITGTTVADLTSNSNYPANPSGSQLHTGITEKFEFTLNQDNYGTRMRAFFLAPKTGFYCFYINSDDYSQLWLSTDDTPSNAAKVAYVDGYTGSGEWGKYASQKSSPIAMAAGRKYYIEALQKEGGGADQVQVGVELPGIQLERSIPVNRLEPWHDLAVVADTNAVWVPENGTAEFRVKLNQAPAGAVTVTVSRLAGDTDIHVQAGATLVFDGGTWNTYQPATLAADHDPDSAAGTASIRCASPDAVSAIVIATEVDDDLATCQIVGPTNNAIVAAGFPLTISASFTDVDSISTQCTFYADNTNVIGVRFSCPGSVVWSNPPLGAHALKIVCRDSDGAVCTSAVVNISAQTDTDADGIPDIYDPDADNDGMPNSWEDMYGLGSTVSNSMEDADHDGMPNLHEYIAGTVPTNANSVFRVASISSGPEFSICFLTVSNRVYGVDWCDDLFWADWNELTSGIPGNGQMQSVSDTNTTATLRFYRIRVRLP